MSAGPDRWIRPTTTGCVTRLPLIAGRAAHRPDSRSARRRIRSKSVAEGITLPEL
jgi:hypothetical protein